MNFSPASKGWLPVDSQGFHDLLAESNPLRDNWSDGDLYYEKRSGGDVPLGFRSGPNFYHVPPHIWESYFKPAPVAP